MVFNLIHWAFKCIYSILKPSAVIFTNLNLNYLCKICLQNLTVKAFLGANRTTHFLKLLRKKWSLKQRLDSWKSHLKSSSKFSASDDTTNVRYFHNGLAVFHSLIAGPEFSGQVEECPADEACVTLSQGSLIAADGKSKSIMRLSKSN